jgi:hypothetical protein
VTCTAGFWKGRMTGHPGSLRKDAGGGLFKSAQAMTGQRNNRSSQARVGSYLSSSSTVRRIVVPTISKLTGEILSMVSVLAW